MAKKTGMLRVRIGGGDMLRIKECAEQDRVSVSAWVTIAVMRAVREAEAAEALRGHRR